MVTMNLDLIAQMSCNPAIGGIAKGHLVREIDALGGVMGEVTDAVGIQFRLLNTSRGPAVWSPRAQMDKKMYRVRMREVLEKEPNLRIKQAEVAALAIDGPARDRSPAARRPDDRRRRGDRHHRNVSEWPGARRRDAVQLRPQRRGAIAIAGRSVAHARPAVDAPEDRHAAAPGRPHHRLVPVRTAARRCRADAVFVPDRARSTGRRSSATSATRPRRRGAFCCEAIPRSPLYSGQIEGIGPRYCPSIEDKIVKFPDKLRHQIFLEPEGLDTNEVYVNGMSTSMPIDVQAAMVASIPGLEHAEMIRPGYAIEYDAIDPRELAHTLEVKSIRGPVPGRADQRNVGLRGGRRARD